MTGWVIRAHGPTDTAVALHPRLTTPMRLVDMLVFWAEHDDHHVHKIRRPARPTP